MLQCLDLYTHRLAIAHDRLLIAQDGQVRFRWRDYAHGNRLKTMTLPAEEFLRRCLDEARDRFLLRVLPSGRSSGLTAGFVRIRHFGFLANRGRTAKLACCRALLAAVPPEPPAAEPVAALMLRLTGLDITRCPVCCTGRLRRSTGLTAGLVAIFRPGARPVPAVDTS